MEKTKYDMAVDVMAALLNISVEKANELAENGHGEFKHLMKSKKSYLEGMHKKALDVLFQRGSK